LDLTCELIEFEGPLKKLINFSWHIPWSGVSDSISFSTRRHGHIFRHLSTTKMKIYRKPRSRNGGKN
jgi:hypothetical protein